MMQTPVARTTDPIMDDGKATHARLAVVDRAAPSLSHVDVLILDAHTRQALICAHVYGEQGLGVGIISCAQEAAVAIPAFASRWCDVRAVLPDFSTNPDAFNAALLALIRRYRPRMVLPGHDGSIEILRAHRAALAREVALPLASERALDVAVSKARTMALARSLGIATPRGMLVTRLRDAPAAMAEIGMPLVVKPVQSWVEHAGVGWRVTSELVTNADAALRAIGLILSKGGEVLLQEWLPGRRDAVSLFYTVGKVWARFAQTSYREFPALGGVSVLCEGIPLQDDIVQPAEALVRTLGLEGCSMVEFRRDANGRPVLMEVNPRIGGSVALAVRSGVDFPTLTYDWAVGRPLREVSGYRVGRRLRWLAGDIWHLKTTFSSQGLPDVPSSRRAVRTFLLDFIQRPSALDAVDPRDIRPAFVEAYRTLVVPYQQKREQARAARRAQAPQPLPVPVEQAIEHSGHVEHVGHVGHAGEGVGAG